MGDEIKYRADLPGPGTYESEKFASIESRALNESELSSSQHRKPKLAPIPDRFEMKKNVYCKEWARELRLRESLGPGNTQIMVNFNTKYKIKYNLFIL